VRDEQKGLALGVMTITLFGLTLPITKLLIPLMHPAFIRFGCAVLAAIVALIILLYFKQKPPTIHQAWKPIIVASTVVIAFPILSAMAMQTTQASDNIVISSWNLRLCRRRPFTDSSYSAGRNWLCYGWQTGKRDG